MVDDIAPLQIGQTLIISNARLAHSEQRQTWLQGRSIVVFGICMHTAQLVTSSIRVLKRECSALVVPTTRSSSTSKGKSKRVSASIFPLSSSTLPLRDLSSELRARSVLESAATCASQDTRECRHIPRKRCSSCASCSSWVHSGGSTAPIGATACPADLISVSLGQSYRGARVIISKLIITERGERHFI